MGKRTGFLFALLLCAFASVASAYTVKLKDGSIIFARVKYTVRGDKAIITLPNGTVTQIALSAIDVPGTEKYNRENPGNVIALDAPQSEPGMIPPTAVPTASLQDAIRGRRTRVDLPSSNPVTSREEGSGPSWQPIEQNLQAAFAKVFDGAGISQYRLQNFRGATKLLATANTEEAVFNTLSATARALADYGAGAGGKSASVEIALTTSSGESAGTFQMTTEHARLIVNGNVRVQDYFLKNVVL
ncbi:MAG: hypothetical protein ABR576_05310 [Thermoanaerobaculia bacterium]